jgi:hypothetical protein
MRNTRRRGLRSLRFRPVVSLASGGASVLGRRLLLSADAASGAHASAHAQYVEPLGQRAAHSDAAQKTSSRTTPAQQINKQYALFSANFQTVVNSYVRSLDEESTGTVSVSTTLTAPYLSGTGSMQVADASVFGAPGTFTPTVTAYAMVGSSTVGTFYLLGSSGNLLAINTTSSTPVSLASGTTLTANVTTSASSAAAAIFPNYVTSATQQLAVNLVSYFNALPFKLPRMFAFPHQSQRTGALQQYVYQVAAGGGPDSLRSTLNAVTLPATPGGDLQIYQSTVMTAINASRLQMLDGVQQIFAGKLQVVPTSLVSSSSASTSGTSSTGTSSPTSTGSSSTSS